MLSVTFFLVINVLYRPPSRSIWTHSSSPSASREVPVPYFLRKPKATCDFPGDADPLPPLAPFGSPMTGRTIVLGCSSSAVYICCLSYTNDDVVLVIRILYILKDFRNAPVTYSLYLPRGLFEDVLFITFYPLTQWTMICHSFDLLMRFILTLVFFNNCRLTAVRLVQFKSKHFELVARCLNQPKNKKSFGNNQK